MERCTLGEALARIPAADGIVLPEVWTSQRIKAMASRFRDWLLPVYGFDQDQELHAAREAAAAAAAGAEVGGGSGAGGEGGGGSGGVGGTPTLTARPALSALRPGPSTIDGADALSRMAHMAHGKPLRASRFRPQDHVSASENTCPECHESTEGCRHCCPLCGLAVHLICGEPVGEDENSTQPVNCYPCLRAARAASAAAGAGVEQPPPAKRARRAPPHLG